MLCNNKAQFETHYEMADIAAIDYYPITGPSSPVSDLAKTLAAMYEITEGKPIWLMPQAFGQKGVWAMPSPQQLNAQMYVGLASGAKAIVWFILSDPNSCYPPSPAKGLRFKDGIFREPQWSTLCGLADEFNTIQSYLVGSDDDVTVSVVAPTTGVYARCFTRTTAPQHMIIVANALPEQQNVAVTLPFTPTNCKALFDSPGIDITNNQITLTLTRYERSVYTFTD